MAKSGLWGSGVPGTGRVPGGFKVRRKIPRLKTPKLVLKKYTKRG